MPISVGQRAMLVQPCGARLVGFGKPVVVDFEDGCGSGRIGQRGLQSGIAQVFLDLPAAGARVGAGLALVAAKPVVIDFEDRIAGRRRAGATVGRRPGERGSGAPDDCPSGPDGLRDGFSVRTRPDSC